MITGRGGKWITHEKRPKSYGKLLWKREYFFTFQDFSLEEELKIN
jgi:hypothetical protein